MHDKQEASVLNSDSQQNQSDKAEILYLGSTPNCIDAIRELCKKHNWNCKHYDSALDGLRYAYKIKPELVITELPMYDVVWSEFIDSLQRFHPQTFCIAVTSWTDCLVLETNQEMQKAESWFKSQDLSLIQLSQSVFAVVPPQQPELLTQLAEQALLIDKQPSKEEQLIEKINEYAPKAAINNPVSQTQNFPQEEQVGSEPENNDSEILNLDDAFFQRETQPFQMPQMQVEAPDKEALFDPELGEVNIYGPSPSIKQIEKLTKENLELKESLKLAHEDIKRKTMFVQQAGTLATIGTQLSDIAQELNNEVGIIMGFAELLDLDDGDHDFTKKAISTIRSASTKTAQAVRRIISISGLPPMRDYEIVDVKYLIHEVLTWRRPAETIDDIDTEVRIKSDHCFVHCDERQIKVLLINLLMNAEQAITAKKEELEAKARSSDDKREQLISNNYKGKIVIEVESLDSNNVRFSVTDNGSGAPKDIVGDRDNPGKIFDPFFTTSTKRERMGLGLAICSLIVKSHSAKIYAENIEDGFRVIFELPFANEADEVEDGDNASLTPAKKHNILVVEDDELAGRLAASILVRFGYTVTWAGSGALALDFMNNEEFDAVVCDYRMPRMNGQEFYQKVVEIHTELEGKFLFTTAYAMDNDTRKFLKECGCKYVMKPFSEREITKILSSYWEKD